MSIAKMRSILAISWAALVLAGCVPAEPLGAARKPVRWIVVEKKMGEVVPRGQVGDGRVDPDAVVLTMQPLYREDLEWQVVVDPHDYFVEVLGISPRASASPGELVTARVRVARARMVDVYRLVARPSRADVEIVGAREQIVLGDAPTSFRFTSTTTGSAGIAIGVERVDLSVP